MSVTACATITLKAGINLEGSSPEAQAWNDSLTTVSQQAGFQRAYWGRQLQDADTVVLLVDWESIASNGAFIASPAYAAFMTHLNTIITDISLHHIQNPTPTSPHGLLTSSPVTEVCTIHNTGASYRSANMQPFATAIDNAKPDGYKGYVLADVVEEIEKTDGSSKGNGVKYFIGWESKEHHAKLMESEVFKSNIGLASADNEGAVIVHVSFKDFK